MYPESQTLILRYRSIRFSKQQALFTAPATNPKSVHLSSAKTNVATVQEHHASGLRCRFSAFGGTDAPAGLAGWEFTLEFVNEQ